MFCKSKNILFLCFFNFFMFFNILSGVIPSLGYMDELIALIAIPIYIYEFVKSPSDLKKDIKDAFKINNYNVYILLLIVIGLMSSVVYHYQSFAQIALPDLLICIKFWLAIYVGKKIFLGFEVEQNAKFILRNIQVFLALYTVLYILDCFLDLFNSGSRYGLNVAKLFYDHSSTFVSVCALMLFCLIMIKDKVKNFEVYFLYICSLMILSLRTRAFGSVVFFILVYIIVYYMKKQIKIKVLFAFLPVMILVGWNQISYYFIELANVGAARYSLLVTSIEIAKDHFPFGAGFGTFGSYFSSVTYSPLYLIYGLTGVNGLSAENPKYITDNFWPMVLGQFGWIGLICYIIALLLLFRKIGELYHENVNIYFSAICIWGYLIISSVSNSTFAHPNNIPLAILLGYLISCKKDVKKKK